MAGYSASLENAFVGFLIRCRSFGTRPTKKPDVWVPHRFSGGKYLDITHCYIESGKLANLIDFIIDYHSFK
jgi:hypothetical protein